MGARKKTKLSQRPPSRLPGGRPGTEGENGILQGPSHPAYPAPPPAYPSARLPPARRPATPKVGAPRRLPGSPSRPGLPAAAAAPTQAPSFKSLAGQATQWGECISRDLVRGGLRSVDRNNKATLLLTRPRGTIKSYAKDLSPRIVKLQDVS